MTNEEAAEKLIHWKYNGGMQNGEAFNLAIDALRSSVSAKPSTRDVCMDVADEVATMCAEDPSVVGLDADMKQLGAALTEIVDRCIANHCGHINHEHAIASSGTWLNRMADAEDASPSISVGGLAADMGQPVQPLFDPEQPVFSISSLARFPSHDDGSGGKCLTIPEGMWRAVVEYIHATEQVRDDPRYSEMIVGVDANLRSLVDAMRDARRRFER